MTRTALAGEVAFVVGKLREQLQELKAACAAEARIRPNSGFVNRANDAAKVMASRITDIEDLVNLYASGGEA